MNQCFQVSQLLKCKGNIVIIKRVFKVMFKVIASYEVNPKTSVCVFVYVCVCVCDRVEEVNLASSCVFFFEKCIFWREGETLFFCDFYYYHKAHLFWKFHWNSSSRLEDMNNFSVNISYFHQFSSIFRIFWYFLVTKKLMTSACNIWCQHFFTFNIL